MNILNKSIETCNWICWSLFGPSDVPMYRYAIHQGNNAWENWRYRLESVLERIDQSRKKNLRIACFVGRIPSEELPQEPGWMWVSLDTAITNQLPADRIHLWIDFNNTNQMQKIKGVFDKVVVDLNVVKFCDKDPAMTMASMLKPGGVLVMEQPCKVISLQIIEQKNNSVRIENQEKGFALDDYSHLMMSAPSFVKDRDAVKEFIRKKQEENPQAWEDAYEEFLQNLTKGEREFYDSIKKPEYGENERRNAFQTIQISHARKCGELCQAPHDEGILWAEKIITDHLLELFGQVEVIRDQPFPYRQTKQEEKPSLQVHIVAKGRKE